MWISMLIFFLCGHDKSPYQEILKCHPEASYSGHEDPTNPSSWALASRREDPSLSLFKGEKSMKTNSLDYPLKLIPGWAMSNQCWGGSVLITDASSAVRRQHQDVALLFDRLGPPERIYVPILKKWVSSWTHRTILWSQTVSGQLCFYWRSESERGRPGLEFGG